MLQRLRDVVVLPARVSEYLGLLVLEGHLRPPEPVESSFQHGQAGASVWGRTRVLEQGQALVSLQGFWGVITPAIVSITAVKLQNDDVF